MAKDHRHDLDRYAPASRASTRRAVAHFVYSCWRAVRVVVYTAGPVRSPIGLPMLTSGSTRAGRPLIVTVRLAGGFSRAPAT